MADVLPSVCMNTTTNRASIFGTLKRFSTLKRVVKEYTALLRESIDMRP